MTQLRAVLLAPPGTQPKLLRWHHVWLAFALTGLGFCVGVLTLMLAAPAYLKLNSTDLFLSYFLLEPMLLLLNVLPPILLIWFFYFLTRRAWAAFLGSFLPCVGLALVNYFKIRLRGDPLLAADLRLVTEAGGIVGHYQLDLTWLVWFAFAWAGRLGWLFGLLSVLCAGVCGLPDPGSPVLRFPSAPRDRPGPPSLVLPVLLRRPAGGVLCGPLLRPEPV